MLTTPDLRKALGSFATGVTIVTTRVAEKQFGFTANSFTSVSLSPPTVLFCIGKARASYFAFCSAASFTVNILSASQQDLSDRFARSGDDKWQGVEFAEDALGNAVLFGAAAAFTCRRRSTIEEADHAIVLGEITDFRQYRERTPLVYCGSRYCLPKEITPGDTFDRLAGAAGLEPATTPL